MAETQAKPRVKVPAGSNRRPTNAYMRDTQSGVIASRPTSLRAHRDEVRRVWWRASSLAMDMLQNSGRLRGAADQMIADSVGVELSLNPQPDLTVFGYDAKESTDFVRLVKSRFKVWAWSAAECDFRGKFTLPQQTDIGIRNWLGFGESLGVVTYMNRAQRRRYGIKSGTKFLMFSPARLVQDTNEAEGLFQGILHDENSRPIAYRFAEKVSGITVKRDYVARDADGRQLVMHAFDPFGAEDVRGITPLAPTFRKYIMTENVEDAAAEIHFLQTLYAIILTSSKPSADAFEAFEALKESGAAGVEDVATDFASFFKSQLDRAAEAEVRLGPGAGISQLAPGETLDFKTSGIPGKDHLPFVGSLLREQARALGLTYGGFTLDYTSATYASTMMETAALWPIATRRTDRIAAPHLLVPYASWLDEEIGEGRIPFKGGYEVFRQNRDAILWALCLGPNKPTADDEKAARAASERLLNGTSSIDVEASANGHDAEEIFERNEYWHKRYKGAGMPSPFERKVGSSPANSEPAAPKDKAAAA